MSRAAGVESGLYQLISDERIIVRRKSAMNDYMEIANSPQMWVACSLPIIVIAFQAILFVKRCLKTASKIGISKTQIRYAVRNSAITSVGPSVVVAVGTLALVMALGTPFSWLRNTFIGAIQYELTSATFGAQFAGTDLQHMTPIAFANAVWVTTICSMGWVIVTAVFSKRFDKINQVISGGSQKMVSVISLGASLACFGYMCVDKIIKVDVFETVNVDGICCITGFIVMVIVSKISVKTGIKWLGSWALTIGMMVGMLMSIPFVFG